VKEFITINEITINEKEGLLVRKVKLEFRLKKNTKGKYQIKVSTPWECTYVLGEYQNFNEANKEFERLMDRLKRKLLKVHVIFKEKIPLLYIRGDEKILLVSPETPVSYTKKNFFLI
jgi:hypothetical protein